MTNTKKYNGFTNYETWNAALWICNEETLYFIAKGAKNYLDLVAILRTLHITETGDGIRYDSDRINIEEMNEVIRDL